MSTLLGAAEDGADVGVFEAVGEDVPAGSGFGRDDVDELRAQHAHTLDALPRADATLAEAGRRVMQAAAARRKTVRVDQLLDGLPRVVV